mgnify:CR=1 FL=1
MHEKLFTIDEARAAIVHLREPLTTVRDQREALVGLYPRIAPASANAQHNGGSAYGPQYIEHAIQFAEAIEEVEQSGAIVKDLSAGLVDFPHEHEGRIVYLCWKLGEDELGWWHEIEDGYAGRQRIEEAFEESH